MSQPCTQETTISHISKTLDRMRDVTGGAIDWVFSLVGQVDHCKNADEGNEAHYEVWG